MVLRCQQILTAKPLFFDILIATSSHLLFLLLLCLHVGAPPETTELRSVHFGAFIVEIDLEGPNRLLHEEAPPRRRGGYWRRTGEWKTLLMAGVSTVMFKIANVTDSTKV